MGSERRAEERHASEDDAPGTGTSEPEAGLVEVRSELDDVRVASRPSQSEGSRRMPKHAVARADPVSVRGLRS
jgi:hypothetical protein